MGDKHLAKIVIPMLFVSGDHDVYAQPEIIKSRIARLGPIAQLDMVDADHSLNKRHGWTSYQKTLDQVTGMVEKWINKH